MFCGKCGGAYVGSRRRRGDGSIWAYYVCNQKARRKQKHNHTKDISKDYIEKEVLKQLAAYAFFRFPCEKHGGGIQRISGNGVRWKI